MTNLPSRTAQLLPMPPSVNVARTGVFGRAFNCAALGLPVTTENDYEGNEEFHLTCAGVTGVLSLLRYCPRNVSDRRVKLQNR